jgi:hypothetical protein
VRADVITHSYENFEEAPFNGLTIQRTIPFIPADKPGCGHAPRRSNHSSCRR